MKKLFVSFIVFCLYSAAGFSIYHYYIIEQEAEDSIPVNAVIQENEHENGENFALSERDTTTTTTPDATKNNNSVETQIDDATLVAPASAESFLVYDAQGQTIFGYRRPVTVVKNEGRVTVSPYNRGYYKQLWEYLEKYKSLQLGIIGQYDPSVESSDVGLQRAEDIKNQLQLTD